MPITFCPAPHKAKPVKHAATCSAEDVLSRCCRDQYNVCDEILQSSFKPARDDALKIEVLTSKNGFVDTLVSAYNGHHAVIVRPDDVWIAILTQFNFFVNANAEELRSSFVAHEGKKEIEVRYVGNRYSNIFDTAAKDISKKMEEFITDPTVREWILPSFSTTTELDTVVASVVMMATMKKYFSYLITLECGIPQVTLEGEKQDWEMLLVRLEKLKEYDINGEMKAWHRLLRPVMLRFVSAFDDPHSAGNLDFWQKVCHEQGGGSGPTWVCGWITAFCVFGEKGEWLGHPLDKRISEGASLESIKQAINGNCFAKPPGLALDGAVYHIVTTDSIPCGYADVDVKLNDNGQIFETVMVAGLVGAIVSSSNDEELSVDGQADTLCPQVGWWIYTKRKGLSREEEQMEAIMKRYRKKD